MNAFNKEELDFGFSVGTLTMSREAYPGEDGDISRFGKDYVSFDVAADAYEADARQGALEGILLEAQEDASFTARVIARAASSTENPARVLINAWRVLARTDVAVANVIFAERSVRKAIRDAADVDFDSFLLLAAEFPAVIVDDRASDAEDRDAVIADALASEAAIDNRIMADRVADVKNAVSAATLAHWMTKHFSKKGQKAILSAARSNKTANVKSIDDSVATVRKAGYEFKFDIRTGEITEAKRRQR